MRALFQLRSLCELFKAHDRGYTHAIVSRIDLLFVRPFVTAAFRDTVVVPDYAHFGGLNDRFAAGPVRQILKIMDRVEVWQKTGALAERLMKSTCQHRGVVVRTSSVGYNRRVRIGGALVAPQYRRAAECPLDVARNMRNVRATTCCARCRILH